MKKREDIVQKFSTFLSFVDYHSGRNPTWQSDPELEYYIRRLAQSDPEAKEEFWARYFLKLLREKVETSTQQQVKFDTRILSRQPGNIAVFSKGSIYPNLSILRAERHLSAYLQEACLWAAQKSYQRFKFLRHKYPIEEYFQIANTAVCPPTKLLKNFDFDHPRNNLEGYAKTAITRFVSNTIYQQDLEAKRDKFSDYGLLKDLTTKELKEALASKSINNNKIDSYCLAWQCLDEIHQALESHGSRSLKPPNQKQLKQIAFYYNQRRDQRDFPVAPASEEKIQEMLSVCIQAAREHRTKRFFPLEDYDNLSDALPTPWDTLMQEEEWEQVQSLVSRLFEAMPETGKTMLKLWQGLNLTQTEMTTVLKNKYPELQKQYQIARHLKRYTRNLLRDFVQEWNKIHPDFYLTSEKHIETIKDSMDDCLQFLCKQLFCYTLDRIGEQWVDEEKLLIFSCNGQNLNNPAIADPLNFPSSEILDRLAEFKQNLINAFKSNLETSLGLTTNSLDIVNHRVAIFIDEWAKSKYLISSSGDGKR